MEKELNRAFKNIVDLEFPKRLERTILHKIELEKNKKIRRSLFFAYTGLLCSIFAILYTGTTFGIAFLKSDFVNIISLLFSDITIVAQHWSEFSLSLLETFPALSAITILVPIFTLFISLGAYLELNNHKNHKYI